MVRGTLALMLSARRWMIALSVLVLGASACGDDTSAPTTGMTSSGGSAGSSSGTNAGGSGGAASGAGGSGGSGNAGARDAATDAPYDDASADAEAGFVSCAGPNDPVDFYRANLDKLGKNGALTFRLLESDIVPPGKGINTWVVKVLQADGGVVTGDLVGHATMPNHTHPANVQPEPVFDPDQGAYVVTPLYFYLEGYWRVAFNAYSGSADAGAAIDTVDFNFCVQ
jgi:hypothetical protein